MQAPNFCRRLDSKPSALCLHQTKGAGKSWVECHSEVHYLFRIPAEARIGRLKLRNKFPKL